MTRYLSTNAVTPIEFNQRANSAPSWSKDSQRKPPPGQIITAVPLAVAASRRKAGSVGWVTFLMRLVPSFTLILVSSYFEVFQPRAAPAQRGMTLGSAANAASAN